MQYKFLVILSGVILLASALFSDATPSNADSISSSITDAGGPSPGLDLVFIPVGFDNMDEFNSLVTEHIDPEGSYKGILYFEPFKANSDRFNFLKTGPLPVEIEENFIQRHCQYADSSSIWQCIQDIKDWLSEDGYLYDKGIIIFNNLPPNTGGGWAESLNGVMALAIAREYPPFEDQGHMETVHELAHLLGLTDECVGPYEFNGYGYTLEEVPNCDAAGCAKWCQDYIKNPAGDIYDLCRDLSKTDCQENANCSWRNTEDEFYKTHCVPLDDWIDIGLNCLEGTGCYHNCNGVGAWRPANYTSSGQPTSMMFYMTNALGFDAVDKRHLELMLSEYAAETVSPPSPPSGPATGRVGISYEYTAGGATSSFGHTLEYQFDWKGDETDLSAWGSSTQAKAWSSAGTYSVRARARCANHTNVVSSWSDSLSVTISEEIISAPDLPNGSTTGFVGYSYSYTTGGSTSSYGHSVEYQFDWKGDGTDLSTWGSSTQTKAWSSPDTYYVRARARCTTHTDFVSPWSSPMTIFITFPPIVTSVTLFAPNGSEVVPSGSNYPIQWAAPSQVETFRLSFSIDNAATWKHITTDHVTGIEYSWPVPKPVSNKKKCLVRVVGFSDSSVKMGSDRSDAPFRIEVVKVTSSNGTEPVTSGDTVIVSWIIHGTKKPVTKIELMYTLNGGRTWKPITTLTEDPGSVEWVIPPVTKTKLTCKVKILLQGAGGFSLGSDVSDSPFAIEPPP